MREREERQREGGRECEVKLTSPYLDIFLFKVRCEMWDDAIDSLKQTIQLQQEAGFTSTTGRLVTNIDNIASNRAILFGILG